jgi:hypothetical protein
MKNKITRTQESILRGKDFIEFIQNEKLENVDSMCLDCQLPIVGISYCPENDCIFLNTESHLYKGRLNPFNEGLTKNEENFLENF